MQVYASVTDGHWDLTVEEGQPEEVYRAAKRLVADVNEGKRPPPGRKATLAYLDAARRDSGHPTEAMRRKLHALATELGLDRDDRMDLAEALCLRDDITSWNQLTLKEAETLLTAMEGYVHVRHLRITRRPT